MRVKSRRHWLLQQYQLECSTSLRLSVRSDKNNMTLSTFVCGMMTWKLYSKVHCVRILLVCSAQTTQRNLFSWAHWKPSSCNYQTQKKMKCSYRLQQKVQTKCMRKILKLSIRKKTIYSKTRKGVETAFTPFRVAAHHSYVTGMRLSGIINRVIVHLELKKG